MWEHGGRWRSIGSTSVFVFDLVVFCECLIFVFLVDTVFGLFCFLVDFALVGFVCTRSFLFSFGVCGDRCVVAFARVEGRSALASGRKDASVERSSSVSASRFERVSRQVAWSSFTPLEMLVFFAGTDYLELDWATYCSGGRVKDGIGVARVRLSDQLCLCSWQLCAA